MAKKKVRSAGDGSKKTATAVAKKGGSAKAKTGRATAVSVKKSAGRSAAVTVAAPAAMGPDVLMAQAEAAITNAIESLNGQMNRAMQVLTSLAAGESQGRPVVRTAPLDRTTAMFQRLVSELLDDQLAELLPPLISLRGEMSGGAGKCGDETSADADICRRGVEILDHVLNLAGVQRYKARAGETFDSLIHLGVGEVHRPELGDGVVGEALQCGFRSARGKVLSPARVRVNRV
jgi:hypothetical protein